MHILTLSRWERAPCVKVHWAESNRPDTNLITSRTSFGVPYIQLTARQPVAIRNLNGDFNRRSLRPPLSCYWTSAHKGASTTDWEAAHLHALVVHIPHSYFTNTQSPRTSPSLSSMKVASNTDDLHPYTYITTIHSAAYCKLSARYYARICHTARKGRIA